MGTRMRSLARFMRSRLRTGKATAVKFSMAKRASSYDLDKLLSQEMKSSWPNQDALCGTGSTLLSPCYSERTLKKVQALMHEAIYLKKTDLPDLTLGRLRKEYMGLDTLNRHQALVVLATQFGVDRKRVKDLMNQYLALVSGEDDDNSGKVELGEDRGQAARYRVEQDLRAALIPLSVRLFEQLNGQAGGLKFLVDLRADLLSAIKLENLASLRALETDLRGMFSTWLGPACLELKQITWNDSAGLLEKIVAYEAVHPISNLYDLKRRLGVGRRCFGYFHSALPGEPLVFIEVALCDKIVGSIQEVLSGGNLVEESAASTALFYSISSTQPGLAGIELGTFLIKRVVQVLQQEMPQIQTFVTLSPIPGFLQWLQPKLLPPINVFSGQSSEQTVLRPDEAKAISEAAGVSIIGQECAAMELYKYLTSPDHAWARSASLVNVLRGPLMRLCARYLLQEKKRGRALDPVANFHVRNGANVERLNWMGDISGTGLKASAGIMVNYLYRLDRIEVNNEKYLNKGTIDVSPDAEKYLHHLEA